MRYLLIIFTIFLLLTTSISNGFAIKLSDKAKISVLTCAPGNELYSLFGHTAIRVEDSLAGLDIIFNYGTFDFNTSHFYLKYAQGLLPYQLTISSYDNFIDSYILDKRSVYSQHLSLDSTERQQLFQLLVNNYQPENRTYLYNFLFDNCSTRVRDIIEKSTSNKVQWHIKDTNKNFWNLLDEYLYRMPWIKWGIHTILGQPGAQTATPYQYMFLPDYLMAGLDSATLYNHKLITDTETIYMAPETVPNTHWYTSPFFVFSISTILLIILLQLTNSTNLLNTVSIVLFLAAGLIGVLLIFLGFFTKHPITAPNLNLIWANPLNLIALFFIIRKRIPKVIQKYLIIYLAILALGIPIWFFALPAVPLASLPLILLMLYLCFKLKQIKS